jgi:hypothetical protein
MVIRLEEAVTNIAYYFADVILPDDIEIFANEAGLEGIENLVDGPVKWDDFALKATPGWLGSEIRGLPDRARLVDLLARSGLRVITIVDGKMRSS